MGLITGIYNMMRQSDMDEMRKREFEAQMQERQRRYQDDERSRDREVQVGQAMADVYNLKQNASQLRIRATLAEQEGQKRFASMDPEAGKYFGSASGFVEQAMLAEKLAEQRGNELRIKLAEGNPKLQSQILSEIMSSKGLDPSSANEQMVKVKVKRAGDKFGDESEMAYEVPASMASDFIRGTGQAPSPQQMQDPRESMNMLSLFQTASGTGVSPYSTGEQPIDQSMLFSGQPQQSAPQAASSNPFVPQQQPKRKRYNPATGQLEFY